MHRFTHGDLEALDEEVWDEMILSLASEASELTTEKKILSELG